MSILIARFNSTCKINEAKSTWKADALILVCMISTNHLNRLDFWCAQHNNNNTFEYTHLNSQHMIGLLKISMGFTLQSGLKTHFYIHYIWIKLSSFHKHFIVSWQFEVFSRLFSHLCIESNLCECFHSIVLFWMLFQ